MKILIVDDEKLARDRLSRMVESFPGYRVVGEAGNGNEAIEKTEACAPDIVLIDIRMPGMDGIQAARHLSRLSQPPAMIFTTAFADHALEAFETHAVDYLLKPVRKERLQSALEASSKPNKAQASQVRGNLVLVPIENIYYFVADQKYVTVRHNEGEVLIEDPLKNLEKEFGNRFHRIHRNALISLSRVCGMKSTNDGHQVMFKDIENTLEVSRRNLPTIRKLIKNL